MKTLWEAGVYWPSWLVLSLSLFFIREFYAIVSGNYQDTLSDWFWRVMHIAQNEPFDRWTGPDFLLFGVWLTLIIWLTFHLFFRRFV